LGNVFKIILVWNHWNIWQHLEIKFDWTHIVHFCGGFEIQVGGYHRALFNIGPCGNMNENPFISNHKFSFIEPKQCMNTQVSNTMTSIHVLKLCWEVAWKYVYGTYPITLTLKYKIKQYVNLCILTTFMRTTLLSL
jgi:hypothetical protein